MSARRTKWWAVCDDEACGATVVVQPHPDVAHDVPDTDEWESRDCPVCGGWLGWNSDEADLR